MKPHRRHSTLGYIAALAIVAGMRLANRGDRTKISWSATSSPAAHKALACDGGQPHPFTSLLQSATVTVEEVV